MEKYPVYEISNFGIQSRKSDLYVNTFKEHLKTHSFIEKPHRHNFYLLVLFTKGSGVHDIDFDRYAIQPGSLFMLQPGQIHNWQLSADIEGYIAFYSPEIYRMYFGNKQIEDYPFYQSVKSRPELLLNSEETTAIAKYFELMVRENQESGLKKEDKLLNLIDTVHIEMTRKYVAGQSHAVHSYNHKIREFESLLEQYYKMEKSPAFYASKMNMTLKHLNRISKSILGETVTEIITARIILEAKRLLSDKNRSVSQVADALGFVNYPYFGKLFKKQAGMTPGDFRKTIAQ